MAGKTKALIVDDSSLMRKAVRKIFEASNKIEVSGEAENGKEALSLLKEHDVDFVISDLNMPVLDGEMLLKWMKAGIHGLDLLFLQIDSMTTLILILNI